MRVMYIVKFSDSDRVNNHLFWETESNFYKLIRTGTVFSMLVMIEGKSYIK